MAGYFFGCPHCRAKLEARDASRAGRTVVCPKCEQSLIIPPPPKMGVSLSQAGGDDVVASEEGMSQVVVSSDPGFKRPMSPAKGYSNTESQPPASQAGYEKLPPSEPLDSTAVHSIVASDDVEGYRFTLPEARADTDAPLPKTKKKRTPKPEEIDPPAIWESPFNQLLALVFVVVVIGGVWTWMRSGTKDNSEMTEAEAIQELKRAAREAPSQPPPTSPPNPGVAPGPVSATTPGSVGAATSAPPAMAAPMVPGGGAALPAGAVPNVLPGANDTGPVGTTPRALPGSIPNIVPTPAEDAPTTEDESATESP